MHTQTALDRFAFLADAFEGVGGFAPRTTWAQESITTTDQNGAPVSLTRRVPKLSGPCHLTPYQRESNDKYAGRAALATYENHLRETVERYVGFLGRKRPARDGTDAPLVRLLLEDADMCGTPLDQFLTSFALKAKARGSMLLMLDMPDAPDGANGGDGLGAVMSLQQQIEARMVPRLRAIAPEALKDFEVSDDTGLLDWAELNCTELVDGRPQACVRRWDAQGWQLRLVDKVLSEGPHPFGACPLLAFTESGDLFPVVGKYAQIADLSRDLFNLDSELREMLRSQTFSILTMQVPLEASSLFDPLKTSASIGTQSMLVHQGATPAFVAPPNGPAEVYMAKIEQRQASIKRIAMDDASADTGTESGVARKLRFERLNADLATFASRLQALEARMWQMFHRAMGTQNRVVVTYPTDFNLVDSVGELDILTLMQAANFPAEVIAAKQCTIIDAEFDTLPDADKTALKQAVMARTQEVAP